MKKQVEIICVLDRSGSMHNIMDEAIAALNSFIDDQKKIPGKASFTLVAFDDQYDVILDKIKLKKVRPITKEMVAPRGMTALNDAIGKTIAGVNSDDVVLLIQTDGQENASQEYTIDMVKELIAKKEKQGWDISFIGAGIDAFASGELYGLPSSKCISVDKTKDGMDQMSNYARGVTAAYRS